MADYWDSHSDDTHNSATAADTVRYAFDAHEWAEFPVSAIFETYRDAYGLSVDDVSNALKIRNDYLKALERGDFDALPGRTFAICYARSYANYLQLPVDHIVERFKAEAYNHVAPALTTLAVPEPRRQPQLSRGLVVLVSLVLLIASWGLWLANSNGWSLVPALVAANEDPNAPSQPNILGAGGEGELQRAARVLAASQGDMVIVSQTENPIVPTVGEAVSVFGVPLPQVRPVAQALRLAPQASAQDPTLPRIVVEASALAWIQVYNSRNVPVVAQMLQAGQSQVMPPEMGLVLTTGSIEALSISVDGQALRLPDPQPGSVVTRLSLDPAELQALGLAF